MTKLTMLRNRYVKRLAQIFSLTTIGFVFQACYGPPSKYHHPDFIDTYVKVLDEDDNPLKGIEIIINDSIHLTTDESGNSSFEQPYNYTERKIHISGNEFYQACDTTIAANEYTVWLDIKLEKK